MPHLGYHTHDRREALPMPRHLYHDLATWHLIPSVYTPNNLSYLRRRRADRGRTGTDRAADRGAGRPQGPLHRGGGRGGEDRTVRPAQSRCFEIPLRNPIETPVTANDLDNAVHDDAMRIVHAIELCLQAADVKGSDIQSVFLTGGSTAIAEVRRADPCARSAGAAGHRRPVRQRRAGPCDRCRSAASAPAGPRPCGQECTSSVNHSVGRSRPAPAARALRCSSAPMAANCRPTPW